VKKGPLKADNFNKRVKKKEKQWYMNNEEGGFYVQAVKMT